MRPDRIVVGEIRRKEEALVLFEAMQTGHSVYATLHANNAEETVQRMINEPIAVPKAELPALGLILVQYRNRRTGRRRTLQVAEVDDKGDARVIYQYDAQKDVIKKVGEPKVFYQRIGLYTGMKPEQIRKDLKQKKDILERLLKAEGANDIRVLGYLFARYYTSREFKPADIQAALREARGGS
jgi:flagellar protein FlaI